MGLGFILCPPLWWVGLCLLLGWYQHRKEQAPRDEEAARQLARELPGRVATHDELEFYVRCGSFPNYGVSCYLKGDVVRFYDGSTRSIPVSWHQRRYRMRVYHLARALG